MQTIAQQLKITKFPFEIKDDNGKCIYHENSKGYWSKSKYDEKGNRIYIENSDGFWSKREFNEKGNEIYLTLYEDNKLMLVDGENNYLMFSE